MFSSKNESRYKREKSLADRCQESASIIRKFKSHVPVIVDKDPKSTLPDIERQKFLVPSELSIGQFIYVVRKRINLQSTEAIFLFVNKKLPPPNSTMGALYEENRDEDGFMYCLYSSDNSFGSN